MEQYFFQIAGTDYCLSAPHSIRIGENLRPFLTDGAGSEDSCVSIRMTEGDLPDSVPSEAHWHGLSCFTQESGDPVIYHCRDSSGKPYAKVRFSGAGEVLMTYPQSFSSWFQGSVSIFNRISLESLLLLRRTLVLHASMVKFRGNGIVFSGPSGIGKSTQAKLWETFRVAEVICGDRVGLNCRDGVWTGWGLPYAGTSGIYRNDSAPIAALVMLRQGAENSIRTLSAVEVFRLAYGEISNHPWDAAFAEKCVDLLMDFLGNVPAFLLTCRPDENAVCTLEETLVKGGFLK